MQPVHRPIMTAVPEARTRRRFRACRTLATVGVCGCVCLSVVRVAHAQDLQTSVANTPAPLTAIKSIRALSPEAARRSHRVLIRGTVTYINQREPAGMIVHDGRAGVFVRYGRRLPGSQVIDLRPGDVIEVQGRTTAEGFAPDVRPEHIRRIGHGALPVPKRVSYAALSSGSFDCDYIDVVGVGQRAWLSESGKTLFLDVAVEGGSIRAWFWDFGKEDVTRFIDARIRLRGNVGTLFTPARQVRGISLHAGRTIDARVETSAPDPWSLPVRSIASFYTHQAMDQVDRRVRLRGTVTATRVGQPTLIEDITLHSRSRDVRHKVYVRDESSAAQIETEQSFELSPGDVVEAAGFPIVSSTKPRIQNALLRKVGAVAVPAPLALSLDTRPGADHDSELVKLEATVLADVATPTGRSLVLKAGDSVFEASHDPMSSAPTATYASGSVVSVTGVYALEAGSPPSFRVLLRSAGDVVLLAAAPWWTSRHTLVLLLATAVTGIIGLVWVRMIANRNALAQQQYRGIIAERSRLASELHDTLEQGLAGIQLQLGAVARTLDSSPSSARRALSVASDMLRYSLAEARRSVMDLRHGALETRDLVGALSEVAERMTTGTPVSVSVRTAGAVRPLEPAQEHHLLRIGLEALTNAIKHSGATSVDVELRFEERTVRLVVSDNGAGFADPGVHEPVGHFGLRGIRERVDKIGGVLRLENSTNGGAIVAVTAPNGVDPTMRGESRHG
jgi:signal transduction histidine kinase